MNGGDLPCRVAIVAREPVLREGLAHIVAGSAADVVGCVAAIENLASLAESFDVVVVLLTDPLEALACCAACGPQTRVIGVHDSLAPSEVGTALAAGVATMIDTSAAPAALIDAVVGTDAGTRLRWSRPAIGPMPLAPRERSVLALVAAGRTSCEIATALGISTRTVETHKQRIFERLGVQNQAHAVAIAVRAGMLDPVPANSGLGAGRVT